MGMGDVVLLRKMGDWPEAGQGEKVEGVHPSCNVKQYTGYEEGEQHEEKF